MGFTIQRPTKRGKPQPSHQTDEGIYYNPYVMTVAKAAIVTNYGSQSRHQIKNIIRLNLTCPR